MCDEIYQQMTLWELIYPKKKIEKPIRLIELFAGIGAQYKALKQLTSEVESWKICEWAYNSYCSYNAIHIKDFNDYSQGLTKEELIEKVKGTSTNYDEPLTADQLKRKPMEWLKNAYNNIVATHNLINIMEVHGKDLEIVDTDKYEYIMTYSFPCQDLSLAGKRQGMGVSQAEGGTRSGLLWEVERILDELKKDDSLSLPQILLMENVPQVIGPDFEKWQLKLETLGYRSYVDILNAKNYGIPQNRKRCFMVSILGDYAYDFPHKMALKYRLKDLLEKEVDEQYYLSDAFLNYASGVNYNNEKFNRNKMFVNKLKATNIKGIAGTITTREGARSNDTFIIEDSLKKELCNKLVIDGLVKEGDIVKHSYTSQILDGKKKAVEKSDEMITLTTRGDCFGVTVSDERIIKVGNYGNGHHAKNVYDEKGISSTITTGNHGLGQAILNKNLRIRKLTPKECMRLMGFTDQDYESMRDIGMSDIAIYHIAGDSIVVTVLMALFSTLIYEEKSHLEYIKNYIKELKEEKENEEMRIKG